VSLKISSRCSSQTNKESNMSEDNLDLELHDEDNQVEEGHDMKNAEALHL